jgi:4-hydroxybenzoate polyprenyltransferase
LTVLYSIRPFRCKKHWLYANIIIALFRGLLIVLAGWSAVKSLNYFLPWYIGLISFLFLLGAATTKDIADIKGDRKNKCQTLPVRFGLEKTAKILYPFFTLPFLLIPLGVYLNILHVNTLPLTLLTIYGIYTSRTIKFYPEKTTIIERNHISWKHTYIIYMIFHLGMCVAYLLQF